MTFANFNGGDYWQRGGSRRIRCFLLHRRRAQAHIPVGSASIAFTYESNTTLQGTSIAILTVVGSCIVVIYEYMVPAYLHTSIPYPSGV